MKQLLKRMPWNFLSGFCAVSVVVWLILPLLGAWSTGGNSMWDFSETVIDADGTFTTIPRDLGASEVGIITLAYTDIKGAAPKVDCTLYSGVDNVVANGTSTGDTFTQVTAKGAIQAVAAEGKAFHQYLWANCTGTGTISTVTVRVYTTGKL